jgi:hypothetical protein
MAIVADIRVKFSFLREAIVADFINSTKWLHRWTKQNLETQDVPHAIQLT